MTSNLLQTRVAPDEECRVIEDPTTLAADFADYFSDESKLASCTPASLAFPETPGQLATVLARHHAQGHPVVVSGARTGVVGGAVASAAGVHLVSTERLSGVENAGFDSDGRPVVRALAGTPLVELSAHVAEHWPDMLFPVDPTESSASIGGMVSTNASGTRSLRYGATRSWVRALEVVLADGRVLSLRRGEVRAQDGVLRLDDGDQVRRLEAQPIPKPNTKHAIGYCFTPDIDAVDLFVGAEGTLGVVAQVELALTPRPAASLYYLQFFPHDEAAFAFVDWLRAEQTLQPAAIEYLDDHSLALLVDRVPPSRSRFVGLIDDDCRAAIYVELELAGEQALDAALECICEAVEQVGGSLDHSMASTEEADWRALKLFRHAVPEQINATIAQRKQATPSLHKISTDMAVPDEHLRALHAFYRQILQSHGLEHFIFGHVGSNHFHVNITPRDAGELELAMKLYREVALEVRRLGGAVAAEHGIGRLKRSFLELQYEVCPEGAAGAGDAAALQTMRQIKRFFDPAGRLNPGVLFSEQPPLPPAAGGP